jgi:hypothetical protein
MTRREILKKAMPWMQEVTRWREVGNFVEIAVVYESTTHCQLRFTFYTDRHKYYIRVGDSSSGKPCGYLGCVADTRKPRAGENHTRGNDLADGPFTQETWNRIKDDILSYEFVKIAKSKRGIPVAAQAPTLKC